MSDYEPHVGSFFSPFFLSPPFYSLSLPSLIPSPSFMSLLLTSVHFVIFIFCVFADVCACLCLLMWLWVHFMCVCVCLRL